MSAWSGQTAVVTGAGSGIGRALALAVAKRGAHVVVTDVNGEAARAVAEACGGTARTLDVRDFDAVDAVIGGVVEERGRIDYLFNNAGIGVGGEVHELELAHWNRIIDVNIRGVVHGVHAAYPRMVAQGSGHIVNVASLAGLGPAPLLTPYSMTKHAVVGLSTSLRLEAAPLGVRVSVLCPAAIETPMLDGADLPDLPKAVWRFDLRRYLTALAGPPHPVEAFTEEALDAVARNVGVIVIPGRARFAWRLGRWAPALVDLAAGKAVAAERATRT